MSDIYETHDRTFRDVSAYVVLKDGLKVATVAFKFARSGLTTQAFVHWIGSEMTRGRASGGGYDKASAAVADAARKIKANDHSNINDFHAFVAACIKDGGERWDSALAHADRGAGFNVFQAV